MNKKRLAKKVEAARFLEEHADPVMNMLADVVNDLAEENESLTQFSQDLNLAMELGWRLDQMFHSNDPLLESLDSAIGGLIALVAIGVWRGVARVEKLRGQRLDKLRDRLQKRGPDMAVVARRHLERRIKRLEAKSRSIG
jgi:hypothetical protein